MTSLLACSRTSARSMLQTVEGFFGWGVSVGHGQCGAKFVGGRGAVALFFEELSEQVVSFEGWALLHRRLQIAAQESYSHGNAAVGAKKQAGAVHERLGAVERAGLHGSEGLLHAIELVGVAIKDGEIEPGVGTALAGVDGGPVFALGGSFVLCALGEACG